MLAASATEIFACGLQEMSVWHLNIPVAVGANLFFFFENECWLPDIAALLPEVLPALCKINFKSCSGICLKKIQQTMLEKRRAAVMWVNTESDHLHHVLLCPVRHSAPRRSSHHLLIDTCGRFIH